MLAKLKERLSGGANRLQGRTDLLEAVCASAALVAAADGSIDDSEIEGAVKAVTANEALNTAFDARQIEGCMQRMLDRAGGGRVGQMTLMKELDDIASNTDDAEMVLLTAMDIADADGTVDETERAMIDKIAKRLGLKAESYA
ncbi:tellurite resistance TerB family protein [Salipiger abyssi]|uniref:Tellurite resistance protein TerB n=2 Tax=Salipiger abyssi TaxID=1250539 RepID=A0A1P8UWF8_9RHOB|nr:TerB family tellurite resistance protein [Salipiger abyssi]APZ53718.1 tellurite resistance protein TerB [Salipiger abyssi]